MDPHQPHVPTASEHNAVALARIEERLIALQSDVRRIEINMIPGAIDWSQKVERAQHRQWAALVVLFVGFAALTGESLLPFLT